MSSQVPPRPFRNLHVSSFPLQTHSNICFSLSRSTHRIGQHIHVWWWFSCSVVSDSLQPHGLYSSPGSSVHRILQARILEWVAISFSRGSSWSRNWTWSPALQADSIPTEPPGKHILSNGFTHKLIWSDGFSFLICWCGKLHWLILKY